MADFRAIFGVDDSENEEFLGFDLDNIKEAEEKYVRQLDVLNDFDSDIEFSEMGSSAKEEIDSNDDTVLAS
jgi:predicted RNA-binding protein Jag